MPLTHLQCERAIPPSDRAYVRMTDAGGMYLEVSATGSKYWRLKYRYGGKEKRLALGVYPSVTLAAARQARDKAKNDLALGKDPGQVKREAKFAQALSDANTFEKVAHQWFVRWSETIDPRHAGYVMRRLEADVFPRIGRVPISKISAPMLLDMAKSIEARGAVDVAKRSLQTCGQIFRYAIPHGLADRNPVADFRPADVLKPRKKRHYARIQALELPEFLRKVEGYEGSAITRLAMKLMALTFVRTSELIEARWSEIDFIGKQWRIPAERMKMPTEHIVPLSRQAVTLLLILKNVSGTSQLLFPGERRDGSHMSNNTILAALKRMGYAGRMTGHGYRGLASTQLHEMGFDHQHIELQLAHLDRNQVSAAYNHATYLKQRRTMMQAWADYLDQCLKQ
ncbi:MAG: integrase arm-type DNA-binding domain-containing protein [Pseudomonadota bacterium]